VSMMAGAAGVSTAQDYINPEFSPTTYGQVAADGDVCYVAASDIGIGTTVTNDAEVYLWVVMTATGCEVRVSELHEDFGFASWYDTGGSAQGDPGAYPTTYATIYDLGEQPDSINIYTVSTTNTTGTPSFTAIGTYTDDNQTTFFAPTQDVKYGKYVRAATSAGPGFDVDIEQGEFRMKFTFRKAGASDVEVEFICDARSQSTSEL